MGPGRVLSEYGIPRRINMLSYGNLDQLWGNSFGKVGSLSEKGGWLVGSFVNEIGGGVATSWRGWKRGC